MLWILVDAGVVLLASLVVVLRTITVNACFEVAELAGEDSTVALAVVALEAVSDALCTAGLAEAAGGVLELAIVSSI